MDLYSIYNIDNGVGLKTFLEASGLLVEKYSGINGSQNCIFLPDLTSFNWKGQDHYVRINCKENAKNVIEAKTGLSHIDNGPGDPTRPFSFIIEVFPDLIDAVYALKTIDGNKSREFSNLEEHM